MLYSMLNIKDDNFDGKIPRNLKHLVIEDAFWVGYEKILEIDSVTVNVHKNRISYKDWNLFLKKWMAMETHLNLELWDFCFESMEEFRVLALHDIPHEVVDEDVKRTLKMSVDIMLEH